MYDVCTYYIHYSVQTDADKMYADKNKCGRDVINVSRLINNESIKKDPKFQIGGSNLSELVIFK